MRDSAPASTRAKQGTAQGVAERVAEAGLQRLDDEPGAVLVDRVLGQGWALCDEHCSVPFVRTSAI